MKRREFRRGSCRAGNYCSIIGNGFLLWRVRGCLVFCTRGYWMRQLALESGGNPRLLDTYKLDMFTKGRTDVATQKRNMNHLHEPGGKKRDVCIYIT